MKPLAALSDVAPQLLVDILVDIPASSLPAAYRAGVKEPARALDPLPRKCQRIPARNSSR